MRSNTADSYAPSTVERTDILRAGEYFLAVQGLAMIRSCVSHPSAARQRVDEMRGILDHFDDVPNSLLLPVTEYDVEAGYSRWARTYDGPNPAIEREEPVVRALLADVAPGTALDAACGTGRHAAWLAQLGHKVIGVDTTEAMLAIARGKVQGADFRRGARAATYAIPGKTPRPDLAVAHGSGDEHQEGGPKRSAEARPRRGAAPFRPAANFVASSDLARPTHWPHVRPFSNNPTSSWRESHGSRRKSTTSWFTISGASI